MPGRQGLAGTPGYDGERGYKGDKGYRGDDCGFCPPGLPGVKGEHGDVGKNNQTKFVKYMIDLKNYFVISKL